MRICGIDEAGRGPLAGPVYAACVVLDERFPVALLNDSKKLSEKARLVAFEAITRLCRVGVGVASVEEIDQINILNAALLAMSRAYDDMHCTVDKALVDGNRLPKLPVGAEAIVKGDTLIPAIMAASIVAKTLRDAYMRDLDALFPVYGFKKHKGYPTALHARMLAEHGPSVHHRKSFSCHRAF